MFISDERRSLLQQNRKRIALSEAMDDRVIKAAESIVEEGLFDLVLIGPEKELLEKTSAVGIQSKVEIIDPATHPLKDDFINQYYDMRKQKGINVSTAYEYMADPVFFATMLVRNDIVDGCVSGNISTSTKVIQAALQILGAAKGKGIRTLSSFFIMMIPDCPYGENGTFLYADCGMIPFPSSSQLAEIGILSARTMKGLLGYEPRVAFLSFSTLGSGQHENLERIIKAVTIAKTRAPEIVFDGELQLDAAIVPEVAKIKAPESPVAGKANVLIFPDLNAGNIAYKLTERLAKAHAYGPVLQGLAKPANDLSRGCSSDDIVNVAAITALQAIKNFYGG